MRGFDRAMTGLAARPAAPAPHAGIGERGASEVAANTDRLRFAEPFDANRAWSMHTRHEAEQHTPAPDLTRSGERTSVPGAGRADRDRIRDVCAHRTDVWRNVAGAELAQGVRSPAPDVPGLGECAREPIPGSELKSVVHTLDRVCPVRLRGRRFESTSDVTCAGAPSLSMIDVNGCPACPAPLSPQHDMTPALVSAQTCDRPADTYTTCSSPETGCGRATLPVRSRVAPAQSMPQHATL